MQPTAPARAMFYMSILNPSPRGRKSADGMPHPTKKLWRFGNRDEMTLAILQCLRAQCSDVAGNRLQIAVYISFGADYRVIYA